LVDGELRYVVNIRVTADHDGDLPDLEDPGVDMDRLLGPAARRSDPDVADEVHREMAFMLCAHCHGRWLDNPLGVRPSRAPGLASYVH